MDEAWPSWKHLYERELAHRLNLERRLHDLVKAAESHVAAASDESRIRLLEALVDATLENIVNNSGTHDVTVIRHG